jgi:hypothetical protein
VIGECGQPIDSRGKLGLAWSMDVKPGVKLLWLRYLAAFRASGASRGNCLRAELQQLDDVSGRVLHRVELADRKLLRLIEQHGCALRSERAGLLHDVVGRDAEHRG